MSADRGIGPEELARAQSYAVIGRLMYGAPDAAVIDYIAQQPTTDDPLPLAQAWKALQTACREADMDAVRLEYDDLFIGVGKAAVTLYTGAYAAPQAPDRHLLALRNELDALGLARRMQAGEMEDHVSALCDAMRWLIESACGLETERRFFFEYVAPAAEPLCAAITRTPKAHFYRSVAGYMQAFYDIERAGFELVGTSD